MSHWFLSSTLPFCLSKEPLHLSPLQEVHQAYKKMSLVQKRSYTKNDIINITCASLWKNRKCPLVQATDLNMVTYYITINLSELITRSNSLLWGTLSGCSPLGASFLYIMLQRVCCCLLVWFLAPLLMHSLMPMYDHVAEPGHECDDNYPLSFPFHCLNFNWETSSSSSQNHSSFDRGGRM